MILMLFRLGFCELVKPMTPRAIPASNDEPISHYSNDYLDKCAVRFRELRMTRYGVSYWQFLARPDYYEQLALEPEPLLPGQKRIAAQIAAYDELQDILKSLRAN